MPSSPMSTTRILASSILKLSANKTYTVDELAARSMLLPEVVSTFVEVMRFCQNEAPLIKVQEVSGRKEIAIVGLPKQMPRVEYAGILFQMYMRGAVSPADACQMDDLLLTGDEEKKFRKLLIAKFIEKAESGYFLTALGVHAILDTAADFFKAYEMPLSEEKDAR